MLGDKTEEKSVEDLVEDSDEDHDEESDMNLIMNLRRNLTVTRLLIRSLRTNPMRILMGKFSVIAGLHPPSFPLLLTHL